MNYLLVAVFLIGYFFIIMEHIIKVNKAVPSLITGVICWTILIMNNHDKNIISEKLFIHMGEISGILFFLLCAMTIVELIEAHEGFDIITGRINTKSKIKMLWIIGIITFFLSAILDNLTTTIVMLMLTRKLVTDKDDRFVFAGIIVIAANAGGSWSPIGDVTTTMLWIAERITSLDIVIKLFFPSLINLLIPLIIATFMMKNNKADLSFKENDKISSMRFFDKLILLICGIAVLVSVPVFKSITNLPPFMGIIIGLGVLWLITEILHMKKTEDDKADLSVLKALRKVDLSSILFFLGILLAISALQSAGVLEVMSKFISSKISSVYVLTSIIGIISSVIDNVPLVAAGIGMYPVSVYPVDHTFWEMLAYCAGTGGSILIIGSAAGIVAMGIEKMDFFKYLKKFSWLALIGYFSGILMYYLQEIILK